MIIIIIIYSIKNINGFCSESYVLENNIIWYRYKCIILSILIPITAITEFIFHTSIMVNSGPIIDEVQPICY